MGKAQTSKVLFDFQGFLTRFCAIPDKKIRIFTKFTNESRDTTEHTIFYYEPTAEVRRQTLKVIDDR